MFKATWHNLVEFGFRLLYNEMAWSYDLVSWVVSLGHWRKWQLASLDYVTGRDVLELAHGPGHMLSALQAKGFSPTGCDLSAAMGRQVHRRQRRAGTTVPLVRCRVQQLPFTAGSFDTVLSQFPTRYIIDPDTLRAVHRVLRPSGRLVILPEGHLTGRGPLYRFIEWLFLITGQTLAEDRTTPTDRDDFWRPYTDMLNTHGFNVEIAEIRLEGSAATVIVATRATAPDTSP